jgi:hypothetical protein
MPRIIEGKSSFEQFNARVSFSLHPRIALSSNAATHIALSERNGSHQEQTPFVRFFLRLLCLTAPSQASELTHYEHDSRGLSIR